VNDDPADERDEIEHLFQERPRSEEELRRRLGGLMRSAAREQLIQRLGAKGALPVQVSTYVRTFAFLGLSRDDLGGLSDIVLDSRASLSGRAVSLALVRSIDGGQAQELARKVPSTELLAMNDAQLLVVIAAMPQTPERIREITEKIARQKPESHLARFQQIDALRKRLGVPAALLYADLLAHEDLRLGEAVVDCLVEEGGAAAAWLCASLFYNADRKLSRDRWADVSARLYRSPRRVPIDGLSVQTFATRGDGGAHLGLVSIESPVDHSFTLVGLRAVAPDRFDRCEVLTLADAQDLDRILDFYPGMARSSVLPSELAVIEEVTRRSEPPAPTLTMVFAAACYVSMVVRS